MSEKILDGVFEGGGVKGVALIGALKRLDEEGVRFKRVAGTSAGAITAALYAAGYSINEIKDIICNKDFNEFADVRNFFKKKLYMIVLQFIPLLFSATGYGAFPTDKFYEWIKKLLADKGITDFKSLKDIYLRVFAVDIVNQKLLQFDKDVSPDLEIADAVRQSMSIPLFFQAKCAKDSFVVDGGVLANYPIDTYNDQGGLTTTIGLKLISEEATLPPSVPSNILAYILRIFETMQFANERIHVEKAEWSKTIPIPCGTISPINFNLKDEEKKFLWDSGYSAAQKAIDEGILTKEGRK
jgi:NTE family protein